MQALYQRLKEIDSVALYVCRGFEDRVAGKGHGKETRYDLRTEAFFAEKGS